MTTSAPSSARRRATARPSRFAAPVTRATCPCSDSPDFLPYFIIFEPETVAHSRRTGILACLLSSVFLNQLSRGQTRLSVLPYNHLDAGGRMNLDLLAIAAHPDDV